MIGNKKLFKPDNATIFKSYLKAYSKAGKDEATPTSGDEADNSEGAGPSPSGSGAGPSSQACASPVAPLRTTPTSGLLFTRTPTPTRSSQSPATYDS